MVFLMAEEQEIQIAGRVGKIISFVKMVNSHLI
jgi:hypothetical protein